MRTALICLQKNKMSKNPAENLLEKVSEKVFQRVIKKLVQDRSIRLDSAQMEVLGKTSARYINFEIDYEKIIKDVLGKIPTPRDGKDLVYTEAIRADTVNGVLQLVPKPKDGRDGENGLNGKDYVFKAEDRADIAQETLKQLNVSEDLLKIITDEIVNRSLFISRENFRKEMKALKSFIQQNKGRPGTAGISGRDMIEEINKVLGDDWQTAGGGFQATVNIQTGNYTAALDDQIVEFNNGSSNFAFTLPPDSEVAFPVGKIMAARKTGSGDITLTRGAGVSFRGVLGDANAQIDGEDGFEVWFEHTATDVWLLTGSVKAV